MSKYNLEKISQNKQKFKTDKMRVPAVLHVSDDLLPEDKTLGELENVASSEYVFHHIASMNDVHSKKGRKNPTGTVVASEKHLLPQINDTAPNCGMRFLKTNLTDEDLAEEKMDKLFKELVKVIPTKKYIGTVVSYSLIKKICLEGVSAVKEHFKTRTRNEIENTYLKGNFFEEKISEKKLFEAVPKFFLWIGKFRLGILGAAGNHFLDLMKIKEIKNEELAQKLGIEKGQYIFLMHTGSGLLGQYASYMYTPKKKEHLSQRIMLCLGVLTFFSKTKKIYKKLLPKIREYANRKDFFAYREGTPEAEMFFTAHKAAANQGFANRSILTHHLDNTIERVLGKNPELDLLYDMTHISIGKERHFGRDAWIHRNGAVRAFGPKRMQNHSVFKETGEPVFIPSSMSTPAYLCVGTDENESGFFSAGHGTGRRKIPKEDKALSKNELFEKMKKNQVKLYNAASKGVVLQDSGYYKDVEKAISDLEANKMVKAVAEMEPKAVIMY